MKFRTAKSIVMLSVFSIGTIVADTAFAAEVSHVINRGANDKVDSEKIKDKVNKLNEKKLSLKSKYQEKKLKIEEKYKERMSKLDAKMKQKMSDLDAKITAVEKGNG